MFSVDGDSGARMSRSAINHSVGAGPERGGGDGGSDSLARWCEQNYPPVERPLPTAPISRHYLSASLLLSAAMFHPSI